MIFLRLFALVLVLVFFLCLAVPLQSLARRRYPIATARTTQIFARLLLSILRIKVICKGHRESDTARLLVANHVSWIDILALASVESASFVGKQEIARWPLIATFAKVEQTIFINRRRRRSIIPANKQMASCLARGRDVLLFPEGTTGDGRGLLKFHSSHFAAPGLVLTALTERESVPVLPLAIRYSTPKAAWVGSMSLLPHIWLVLKEQSIICELFHGSPLPYTRGTNRKVMTQKARAIIENLLTMPDGPHD
ncbi:lysophospholipid acyltransferase family protein [Beijerinckia indica]|uniref:Phospholipid/glycerol acyltransferase n=1 Tax=Beijerinckia indica subsp. indica (strain ATCC 9039 / DSM 1715 / NCIMB 8712) TaxID=395963 RepID=B2IGA9_BEII9|nr:lysophospholipid acyltransferase family protein [Beijerinckia indica]ACB97183.1 phospholipid/glycerol acyltransferase [Beijerinckia indica subsp. indica ATCC 9039]